jgi:NTE family protein
MSSLPAPEPVRRIPGYDAEGPADEVALCMSGGGYRAMVFHLGVLWRLNEAGWLGRLDRVSSVSGGSITAGALALAWDELDFADGGRSFREKVVEPVRRLASHDVDVRSVLAGLVLPGSVGEKVAGAYKRILFGDARLRDLPEKPRFVINATNLGSGALARFERGQIADWRVGRILEPDVPLAVAVACSSAFPPVLSPYRLELDGVDWTDDEGNDLRGPEHRDEMLLTDGGVYDNMGLETCWKRCRTVIVSDAGGQMAPQADPHADWARHMVRVLKVVDSQVRALRKRQTIEAYKAGLREGFYAGIRSHVADYDVPNPLPAPPERTLDLAETPTRLDALSPDRQERLINWGYAICDAGLRRHLDPEAAEPAGFPYPERGCERRWRAAVPPRSTR